MGKSGELYGATFAGGTSVLGTVFVLTPAAGQPWKETILHNFAGSDGQYPQSALTCGSNGEFYGVTVGGGPGGAGAIFELAPPTTSWGAWTEPERSSERPGPDRSRRDVIHHDPGRAQWADRFPSRIGSRVTTPGKRGGRLE
jgi:uncharacterized repeat protein (TIGR03803 family)